MPPTVASHLTEKKECNKNCPNLSLQTALIQRDAVIWMYESVMSVFKPDSTTTYPQCLHKLLFLFISEDQMRADGWPSEQERALFFKACSEVTLGRGLRLKLPNFTGFNFADSPTPRHPHSPFGHRDVQVPSPQWQRHHRHGRVTGQKGCQVMVQIYLIDLSQQP